MLTFKILSILFSSYLVQFRNLRASLITKILKITQNSSEVTMHIHEAELKNRLHFS